MTDLPTNVEAARLPARYEAARTAIAECERVDECKEWADKAAALASYAKQARDDSLRVMAVRIQARAERRAGELLKQIEPARGGDRGNSATGGRPPVGESRKAAADAAGLSEHQRKQALRLASVPADDFEREIESGSPPTITELAERGTRSSGHAPAADREALGSFEALVRLVSTTDPVSLAKGCSEDDSPRLREMVERLDKWCDRFVTNLP